MTILGKVLIVLNLLAALAFAYLAAQDWGKRQDWSYAVYRHALAIDGLPLEKDQPDPNDDSLRLVDRQGERTMQLLAQAAGSNQPVPPTQEEEVQAVRNKLKGEIDGKDGEPAKANRLRQVLDSLARSGKERDELKDMPYDKLQEKFKKTFDDALAPVYDADGKLRGTNREADDKRAQIAHILFNLKSDEPQRVLTVIGLRAYAHEAIVQAGALADMAEDVRRGMIRDLVAFESDNQELVKRIRTATDNLERLKNYLAGRQKLKIKNDDLVTERTKARDQLKETLKDDQKETVKALATQATFEKALFEAQRRLRDAAAANQAYERQLRSLEHVRR